MDGVGGEVAGAVAAAVRRHRYVGFHTKYRNRYGMFIVRSTTVSGTGICKYTQRLTQGCLGAICY